MDKSNQTSTYQRTENCHGRNLRKGDENVLLDGEGTGVEGEFEETEIDILGREGASHDVTEPVGDDLDKEH